MHRMRDAVLILFAAGAAAGNAAADCRGTRPKTKPETELPSLVALRAGQLSVEKMEAGGAGLLLNDCRLALPADIELVQNLEFAAEPTALASEDLVLVKVDMGGNACPIRWRVLSVKPDGTASFSQDFGECEESAKARVKGGELEVAVGEAGSVKRYEYRAGQVRCLNCKKSVPPPEKTLASLDAVWADVADDEVSLYFHNDDPAEVQVQLKKHSTLTRHPLNDGRELLQISFEIGNPLDLAAAGCSGDCSHYFYVNEHGRYHAVGDHMHYVTLDVTRAPATLVVEDRLRTTTERACYELYRAAPGQRELFQRPKSPGDPCGLAAKSTK